MHTSGPADFLNGIPPATTTALFKDSPPVNFIFGNPWRAIGTWNLTLCLPIAVERSDDVIHFITSDMPDRLLDGKEAQLEVHRVKPVFPQGCPNSPTKALVLVHGTTVDSVTLFDLQYQDYSLMENLAMQGIDTLAVNTLGYGFSELISGLDNPLNDPCNASLPLCPFPGNVACRPTPGVCDCGASGFLMDQQGSGRYLNPNPLTSRCQDHTIAGRTRFQRITNQVADIDRAVDFARNTTGFAQVSLLGYSTGGAVVGGYLDDPTREAKIERAILLSSVFLQSPQEQVPPPSFALGLVDRDNVMANFNLTGTDCPAQQDSEIRDAIWASIRARNARHAVGATWGPPDGLSRFPIVTRWGWNMAAAMRVRTPMLVIHGLRDATVPPAFSVAIASSSPLDNRVLVEIQCASHALLWEGCSEPFCSSPYKIVAKQIGEWVLGGMLSK